MTLVLMRKSVIHTYFILLSLIFLSLYYIIYNLYVIWWPKYCKKYKLKKYKLWYTTFHQILTHEDSNKQRYFCIQILLPFLENRGKMILYIFVMPVGKKWPKKFFYPKKRPKKNKSKTTQSQPKKRPTNDPKNYPKISKKKSKNDPKRAKKFSIAKIVPAVFFAKNKPVQN